MADTSRQLAAIMFTDIVGYTQLMGINSEKAIELVRKNTLIQKEFIEKYNGKLVKELGDGILGQFSSAIESVNCAIEIQKEVREQLDAKLRIGIHLGDITLTDNDVFGDGVNIASRIESEADPGGVYISESIHKAIRGENTIDTVEVGDLALKNVDYKVKTYAVQGHGLPIPEKTKRKGRSNVKLSIIGLSLIILVVVIYNLIPAFDRLLPAKETAEASIAVLPFTDMSLEGDQAYFSDGLSEELLNSLAQIKELKVAGRTSSFKFKGQNEDLKKIGAELNVSHILEGSVRKAGDRIRITAQLIKTEDGFHVWSETFDRIYSMDNIFDIQEEISEKVLEELKVRMLSGGTGDTDKKTENIQAYETFLEANHYMKNRTAEDLLKAITLFKRAVELDPDFAEAYARLAIAYNFYYNRGNMEREELLNTMREHIDNALLLDSDQAYAYAALGLFYYESFNEEKGIESMEKAYLLAPNDPEIILWYALSLDHGSDEQVELITKAYEIDPLAPVLINHKAHTHKDKEEYEIAMELVNKNLIINPDYKEAYVEKIELLRDEPTGMLDSAFIVAYEAWELESDNLIFIQLLAETSFDLKFYSITKDIEILVEQQFPDNEYLFELKYLNLLHNNRYDSIHLLMDTYSETFDLSLQGDWLLEDLLDLYIREGDLESARKHIETYFPVFISDTVTQIPEDMFGETVSASVLYRKLGEDKIADGLADLICSNVAEDVSLDSDIHVLKTNELFRLVVCTGVEGNAKLTADIINEYHFKKKSKANIYTFIDTNVTYDLVRTSPEFIEVRQRIEQDVEVMRENAVTYLRGRNNWPASLTSK